jgi:hypothetical protein
VLFVRASTPPTPAGCAFALVPVLPAGGSRASIPKRNPMPFASMTAICTPAPRLTARLFSESFQGIVRLFPKIFSDIPERMRVSRIARGHQFRQRPTKFTVRVADTCRGFRREEMLPSVSIWAPASPVLDSPFVGSLRATPGMTHPNCNTSGTGFSGWITEAEANLAGPRSEDLAGDMLFGALVVPPAARSAKSTCS